MLPKQFYWAFLLLVCGYAFWRGRADERVAATVALAATVATHFAISPDRIRYSGEETGVMLVDLITFAAFTLIALRSRFPVPDDATARSPRRRAPSCQ